MKPVIYNSAPKLRHSMRGFTIVELMIAMVLGLVLVGAAASVMISNSQSFRTGKSLAQVQNSARMGFELMARDIRQAGSIPCGSGINIDNLITNTAWYYDWENSGNGQFVGYSSSDAISGITNRASGTEAVSISYVENYGSSLTASGIDTYKFSRAHSQFKTGDAVFVCDSSKSSAFIANISAADSNNIVTVTAAPTVNAHSQPGTFEKNSVVGKLKSRTWYVAADSDDNRSLYLAELTDTGLVTIEIAAGITDLEFGYRLSDTSSFKSASDIGNDWPLVNAVRVTYTLESQDKNATESGELKREFTSIVALRSRIL